MLLTVAAEHQVSFENPAAAPERDQTAPFHSYLTVATNWDGNWYRTIALEGYPSTLPRENGEVVQNAWAFFPLYPGLVRAGMTVTRLPFAPVAVTVSLLAGALAMVLLWRAVDRISGPLTATATVLALNMFAAAPVLGVAYAESLTLLLIVLALQLLRDRRYEMLTVAGVALSLTRPIVLPLALVIALHGAVRWRDRREESFDGWDPLRVACSAGIVGASFLAWPAIAGLATGEWDAYLVTQHAWVQEGAEIPWPSWLTSFAVGPLELATLTGVAVFLLILVTARPAARRWGSELRWWALCYGLFLAASTRPTPSIFRYAMLMAVPWWPAPDLTTRSLSRWSTGALLTGIVLVGLVTQYVWIGWYFDQGADSRGYP